MAGSGAIGVLDVECGIGRVVWCGGRVVLGWAVLKIEALEGRKTKVAVGHVRMGMGIRVRVRVWVRGIAVGWGVVGVRGGHCADGAVSSEVF